MARKKYSSEGLALGDRVDVCMEDQTGVSDVQDITDDDKFVISVPTFKNMPVHVPDKTPVNIIYYRPNGMFSFSAVKVRDFVQNRVPLVEIQVKSAVRKLQRRNFVRHEKVMPVQLRIMAESEETLKADSDGVIRTLADVGTEIIDAVTLDISGGGLRFSSRRAFSPQMILECTMNLGGSQLVIADCSVVRSDMRVKDGIGDFVTSVKFINMNESTRSKIIKFIFDDQIKMRRRK